MIEQESSKDKSKFINIREMDPKDLTLVREALRNGQTSLASEVIANFLRKQKEGDKDDKLASG